jgi:phage baseplate assembly protein gpV
MEGKIDKDGCLLLKRHGKLRSQWCPWTALGDENPANSCGHWCPHFGEPAFAQDNPVVLLTLTCGNGRLFRFTQFTDERQ